MDRGGKLAAFRFRVHGGEELRPEFGGKTAARKHLRQRRNGPKFGRQVTQFRSCELGPRR
jgi:hypothetical protein